MSETFFPPHLYVGWSLIFAERFFGAIIEPSLWLMKDATHQYRFSWLRSLHPSICVRLQVNDEGSGLITGKIAPEHGQATFPYRNSEFSPKKPTFCAVHKVGCEAVQGFIQQLQRVNGFWEIPEVDPNPMGNDGANWVLEAAVQGRYRVVARWHPREMEFREAALALVDLAKLPADPIY